MTKTEAYYYAGAIALVSLVCQGFQHTFMLHNFHLGLYTPFNIKSQLLKCFYY